ncbi:MAG: DUF3857 domain-containing protein [Rikenellaceae bacterium]|nr:DUF3857 domain-containing protein [Rikenellaceae bacterium]
MPDMKKIFVLMALVAGIVGSVSAQPSEATYNYLDKTYTLAEDGSLELRVRSSLTYNTQSSFFSMFGETFIEYNPEYQTLTINESYTRQADGSITKSPTNAFNEVLPRSAANAPAYNHLREMVVTHVGMERGATAYLDYTIRTSAEMLGGELDFTEVVPKYACDIRKSTITVVLPKGKTLRAAVVEAGGKVRTQEIKGRYTWTFNNVKPFFREQYAPAEVGKTRIYATTLPSTDAVVGSLYYGTRDILRMPAERMAGKESFDDKVNAIGDYVGEMVAEIPIAPALTGYRHAQERSVDERCYGSALDKAFLLHKLLLCEGVESDIELMYPADCPLYNLSGYVAVVVKAMNGDQQCWLNHNGARYTPATKADRYTLLSIIMGKTEEVEHTADCAENNIAITLNDTKATIVTNGGASREAYVASRDGATGVRKITIPYNDPTTRISTLNTSRNEPFELYNTINRSEVFTVTLDEGAFLTAPRSVKVRNALGEASWSVAIDGKVATITRTLKVNRSVVSASEWGALRELLIVRQNPASLSLLAR